MSESDAATNEHGEERAEKKQLRKGVSFGQVRQHVHGQILGDNPSVTKGPPVSLDWDVLSSERIDLDQYELEKLNRCYESDNCDENRKVARIPAEKRERIVVPALYQGLEGNFISHHLFRRVRG